MAGYWRLARPVARPVFNLNAALLSTFSSTRTYLFDADGWVIRVDPVPDDQHRAGEALGLFKALSCMLVLLPAYFVAGVSASSDATGFGPVFVAGMSLAVVCLAVIQNAPALSLEEVAG